MGQADHLKNGFVDVQAFPMRRRLLDEIADPAMISPARLPLLMMRSIDCRAFSGSGG